MTTPHDNTIHTAPIVGVIPVSRPTVADIEWEPGADHERAEIEGWVIHADATIHPIVLDDGEARILDENYDYRIVP